MSSDVSSAVVSYDLGIDSEYLLMEREADSGFVFYDFIGGKIKQDEDALNAVLREFKEETGWSPQYSIDSIRGFEPLKVDSDKIDRVYPNEVVVDRQLSPDLGPEHVGYEWITRGEYMRSQNLERGE